MNYYAEGLNDLIQQISASVLTYSPAANAENPQDLQIMHTLLENVLTRIIFLHLGK
jgi:hypothetical protein